MANPAETPQEFVYETKFVVLNFLGLLPKFEDIEGESSDESEEKQDGDGDDQMADEESQRHRYAEGNDNESHRSDDYKRIRRMVASAIVTGSSTVQSETAYESKFDGLILATDDLQSDALSRSFDRSEANAAPPSVGAKAKGGAPAITITSSPRPNRVVRKRKSKDLLEERGVQDKMHGVLVELESKFKDEMKAEGLSPQGALCAISREAIVAERIAQIGDCIMMHHRNELEGAFQQLLGIDKRSMTYGIFKNAMKNMFKTTVPGWYHLAVTLNFTRQMAVSVLDQGSRGIGAVTDFASRYIEENLAQLIIEQGGWDALTNVDLDKIDSDTWSEISSGSHTPMCPDSPMPASPHVVTDASGYLTPHLDQSTRATGSSDQSDSPAVASETTGPSAPPVSTTGGNSGSEDKGESPVGSPEEGQGDGGARGRSGSFTGPIIAGAATATVAAVAAAGVFAILKK